MRNKHNAFTGVFWIANSIEILERFAYYGIYLGFPIYFAALGFKTEQLGLIQGLFLFISYTVPIISGTFADKFGFKKVLLVSYLAYLPAILLLVFTKSFGGISLSMLCIGLAAGIFKPLISGTVRLVTDNTNRTLGFGIFYAMVNIGASFGPVILGWTRAVSWEYAYYIAAAAIIGMFLITFFFYKEPVKNIESVSLTEKLKDIISVLSDVKFSLFLLILGLFFWMPFWAFFNLCSKYVETSLDGSALYNDVRNFLGPVIANFISKDYNGTRRILGETISHTGWVIILFQIVIVWLFEKRKPISSFMTGLFVMCMGFGLIGIAGTGNPSWIFPGILLFAFGEMISSPRIQEYIVWIAPKEKAGLYMGSNYLPVGIGGFISGIIYTRSVYSYFESIGHTEYLWFILSAHMLLGIIAIAVFSKLSGLFKVQEK